MKKFAQKFRQSERLDGAFFGFHFAKNVFFVAPRTGFEFGGARRNGFHRFGCIGGGCRRRDFNFRTTPAKVIY